jgi:hypothetical protein
MALPWKGSSVVVDVGVVAADWCAFNRWPYQQTDAGYI